MLANAVLNSKVKDARAESKARIEAAAKDLKSRLPRAILEAHVVQFLDRLEIANNTSPAAVSDAIAAIRAALIKNNIWN
jgi:hypothetical protein